MRRKTKNTLKTVAMTVLGGVIILGAVGLSTHLFEKSNEEYKVINPLFSVGGLTEDGKYENTDETIYTKEAFECQGLTITPDFESEVEYRVFFYDSSSDFILATDTMSGKFVESEVPYDASFARIEITPDWEALGEAYEDEENQVIKWYEVSKYADDLEIKVLKETKEVETPDITRNLFVNDSSMEGYFYNSTAVGANLEKMAISGVSSSKFIELDGYSTIILKFDDTANSKANLLNLTDATKQKCVFRKDFGNNGSYEKDSSGLNVIELEITEDAKYLVFSAYVGSTYEVYLEK